MKRYIVLIILLILTPIVVLAYKPGDKYISGDADNSGKVTSTDYIIVRKHILKQTTLTEDALTRGDVNNDNKITSVDYISIRKMILNGKTSEVVTVPGATATPTPTSTIVPDSEILKMVNEAKSNFTINKNDILKFDDNSDGKISVGTQAMIADYSGDYIYVFVPEDYSKACFNQCKNYYGNNSSVCKEFTGSNTSEEICSQMRVYKKGANNTYKKLWTITNLPVGHANSATYYEFVETDDNNNYRKNNSGNYIKGHILIVSTGFKGGSHLVRLKVVNGEKRLSNFTPITVGGLKSSDKVDAVSYAYNKNGLESTPEGMGKNGFYFTVKGSDTNTNSMFYASNSKFKSIKVVRSPKKDNRDGIGSSPNESISIKGYILNNQSITYHNGRIYSITYIISEDYIKDSNGKKYCTFPKNEYGLNNYCKKYQNYVGVYKIDNNNVGNFEKLGIFDVETVAKATKCKVEEAKNYRRCIKEMESIFFIGNNMYATFTRSIDDKNLNDPNFVGTYVIKVN